VVAAPAVHVWGGGCRDRAPFAFAGSKRLQPVRSNDGNMAGWTIGKDRELVAAIPVRLSSVCKCARA